MKEIGRLWSALDPEEKSSYEQKAREDKERYLQQLNEDAEQGGSS